MDQDIISLDVPRSAEEAKQSMRFKDSMREGALQDIAAAWATVVATYWRTSPDTAAAALETVQRYVHWIDIGLVANDTFVPLLFNVLGAPEEGLRGAAADVLTEIVRCGWAGGVGVEGGGEWETDREGQGIERRCGAEVARFPCLPRCHWAAAPPA